MKRRSGFTLIEMMIVLAIIAALSATLVPIAMNALNQAKVTGNLTDVESIRMAQMQYFYKYDTTATKTDADNLGIFLEWGNLQRPNVDGDYDISKSEANKASIQFAFDTEALAKAFKAQFPANTEDGSVKSEITNTSSVTEDRVASITYTFR